MQRVVDGDDGAIDQKWFEEIEIEFSALVGVVAIDPEETDRAIPTDGDVA